MLIACQAFSFAIWHDDISASAPTALGLL